MGQSAKIIYFPGAEETTSEYSAALLREYEADLKAARYAEQRKWFYDGDLDWPLPIKKQTRWERIIDVALTTISVGVITFGVVALGAVAEWMLL